MVISDNKEKVKIIIRSQREKLKVKVFITLLSIGLLITLIMSHSRQCLIKIFEMMQIIIIN